jgi:hypothetical protein
MELSKTIWRSWKRFSTQAREAWLPEVNTKKSFFAKKGELDHLRVLDYQRRVKPYLRKLIRFTALNRNEEGSSWDSLA